MSRFADAGNGLVHWLTGPQGRRWLLRALLAYAAIGFVVWIRREGDFAGYVLVGDLVLQGRHIYFDSQGANTWPPFFSLVCVPLALLAAATPYVARGFWLLLNFGLLLLVLRMIAELVYGRAFSLFAETTGLSLAAPEMLVPLLLTDRYVSGNFDHLQVNIVLFALALGGLHLQRRGKVFAGSFALGAAVAMKVMPVVFIPYLAYRRRWRPAAYTTVAAAGCSLSPIVVFGWARFWEYVSAWRAVVAAGWGVGKMNQSLYAMWDRWIGRGMGLATAGENWVPASGDPLVTVAVIASIATITGLALWLFRGNPERDRWVTVTEWSVVFIASALFGPVSWKAYLVVLLLPNAVLFAAWRSPQFDPSTRRWSGLALATFFVLGWLPSPGLVGKALAGRLEMASVVTLATLVILGQLLRLRARLGRT